MFFRTQLYNIHFLYMNHIGGHKSSSISAMVFIKIIKQSFQGLDESFHQFVNGFINVIWTNTCTGTSIFNMGQLRFISHIV